MTPPSVAAGVDELVHALQMSWDGRTSGDPDWSPEAPTRGQCAVSALVIQDEMGGDLVRAVVEGVSHYWNRLPNGSEVDVTRGQFEHWCPVGLTVRDRGYVLSSPDTAARYSLLRRRVDDLLKGRS